MNHPKQQPYYLPAGRQAFIYRELYHNLYRTQVNKAVQLREIGKWRHNRPRKNAWQ
jgi:hypothetical protein